MEENWQKLAEWTSDPIVVLILAFIGTNLFLMGIRYFYRYFKGGSGPRKGR